MKPRKDLVRDSAGNLLLSCDAVWAQERRSYLSEAGELDVPKAYKHNYGGVHNDMLVKSTTAELHIAHLSEAFQILRNYNMKLNPAKCAFEVSAEKFLGFIVKHQGIEANPEKIKVVLEMPSPSGIKEVQRLTRRIAALSRFVSRASDKCQPFLQVLKKAF